MGSPQCSIIVTDIDAHMGNTGGIVCAGKEDQVSGLRLPSKRECRHCKAPALESAGIDKSAVGQGIRDKSGAVK